uniref:RING-CH-type domain-containing protein n=1 Tax=Oryza meridionalis TaxID=40149 RepID=A0A0E0CF07_9ORYZ
MISVLFIMQLASHATQADEATELASSCDCAEVPASQQIVSESSTAGSSTEHLVSCEIKPLGVDEDIETIDANEETHLVIQDCPQCRICLDNEGDDLIAPCHCKGTQKYVHRSCLDNWRSTKVLPFHIALSVGLPSYFVQMFLQIDDFMEMNYEKCLVMKSIHMLFMQWQPFAYAAFKFSLAVTSRARIN